MHITILMHERHPSVGSPHYLIQELGAVWREQGHQVQVVRGVGQPIRGDIVFLHVDATVVPQKYLAAVADHPRVVNRRVVDISKTSFSRNRVRSPEEWDGPVVVKTVCNSGGHPERRLARSTFLGWLQDTVWRLGERSLARTRWLDPRNYPIYRSARNVPPMVYRNPHLFVERYLPERCGELFCSRTYKVLGNCEVSIRSCCDHPLVKSCAPLEPQPVTVHPGVVAFRRRLGMDYGTLDYVMHEGEPVVLDVNRTPAAWRHPGLARREAEALAPGIERCFE